MSELYDHTKYNFIFFFHDDNVIINLDLIKDIVEQKCTLYHSDDTVCESNDWMFIYNTNAPGTTTPRGSFACIRPEFFKTLNSFSMEGLKLSRTAELSTPGRANDLKDWNSITRNFNRYVHDNNLHKFIAKLSTNYRSSNYIVECERGFCDNHFIH